MSSIVRKLKYATQHTSLKVRRAKRGSRFLRIGRDRLGKERFLIEPDGQDAEVRDVDNDKEMVLVDVKDREGENLRVLLLGKDDHCFVTNVPAHIWSVKHALQFFVPDEVRRARSKGLKVRRQGDWYFIPIVKKMRIDHLNEKQKNQVIPKVWDGNRHLCNTGILYNGKVHVKGKVHHHEIPGEGDIDFRSVFDLLSDADYEHYLSVELYAHADVWERALYQSRKYLLDQMKPSEGKE